MGVSRSGRKGTAAGMHLNWFAVLELDLAARAIAIPSILAVWLTSRQDVVAVGVEVAIKCELVPRDQIAAIARPWRVTAPAASSSRRSRAVRRLSSKIFSSSADCSRPAAIDAVEALGVRAGEVVEFELVGPVQAELVRDVADRNGLGSF